MESNLLASGSILASDLDGTFIPLDGNEENRLELEILRRQLPENKVTLVYVTGRHYESVHNVMTGENLPSAQWIICDVGTSIYRRGETSEYTLVQQYHEHLLSLLDGFDVAAMARHLEQITELRAQEDEKQGPYKLSYYTDGKTLDGTAALVQACIDQYNAPFSLVASVDPFNGEGLIDLLPQGVSKAYALRWLADTLSVDTGKIVFAGDSGNDLAALTAGFRSIIVANADRSVAVAAWKAHREKGWKNRLFLATSEATSGVVQGCRWFGLLPTVAMDIRFPGATPISSDKSYFRVWAHRRKKVQVELHGRKKVEYFDLDRSSDGYFTGIVDGAGPGARYKYMLDGEYARPDPASAFQPGGVHANSMVIDHNAFPWTDRQWQGISKRDLVIYELHIGTFTEKGTFRGAIECLGELVDLGVTAIEIMPVAQCAGRWNWGYDGVDLFAPRNTYGTPDDFKALVDAAHAAGLGVVLDVVYNHLGPEGNYLRDYAAYFSRKHHTPWGETFNFDGRRSPHVRRFIIDNAIYWLDKYHLDGLRLDAVHCMYDQGEVMILHDLRDAVTEFESSAGREIHLIAETNVYDHDLMKPGNGYTAPYDAMWSDCLMHSIYSHGVPDALLCHREYKGAGDIVDALEFGYVYSDPVPTRATPQQHAQFGHDCDRRYIESLVIALQTHDVVGNHPHGKRIHHLASPEFQRAAVPLVLLYPGIPLLFMGEEYATDSPFTFFVDFRDERLRSAVDSGRQREYSHHDWQGALSPSDPRAYQASILQRSPHEENRMWQWYRRLLRLRRRGRSEGWLAADRMKVKCDPSSNLFGFYYTEDSGDTTFVLSRLYRPGDSTETLSYKFHGTLLLDSHGDHQEPCPEGDMELSLQPSHAIVGKLIPT